METGSSATRKTGLSTRARAKHYALQLAAAHLVRILAQEGARGPQIDRFQRLNDQRLRLLARAQAVDDERLQHGALDSEARVERLVGILEHQLCLSPECLQRRRVESVYVLPLEQHLTAGRPCEPQEQLAGSCLAASTLPGQPQRLAPVHMERDTIHGTHGQFGRSAEGAQHPPAQRVVLVNLMQFDDRRAVRG